MRKQHLIVGLTALLTIGLGAVLVRYFWQGPLGNQREIRRWAHKTNDYDPLVRKRADARLYQARDPVRVCLTLLEMKPTRWDRMYTAFWTTVAPKLAPGLTRRFSPLNWNDRLYKSVAVSRLGQLGPRATNAVPTLVTLLNVTNRSLRPSVIETLGRIGAGAGPAMPQLTRLLADFNSREELNTTVNRQPGPAALSSVFSRNQEEAALREARSVVTALGEIGVRDEAAIQALARTLTNRNWDLRLRAVEAIWRVEREPQRLLQLLAKWDPFLDAWDNYRRPMGSLVAEIAAVERQALPILERFLTDRTTAIRLAASKALFRLDGQTNRHVQLLMDVLKTGNENDRWLTLDGLTDFALASGAGVPLIVRALADESNRVRGKAAVDLGKLGSAAEAAIPALRDALHDTHSNVRDAAAEALAKIQPVRTGQPATAR
jgi:HEAT repeat protein